MCITTNFFCENWRGYLNFHNFSFLLHEMCWLWLWLRLISILVPTHGLTCCQASGIWGKNLPAMTLVKLVA
jgi:hypothetical protein